MGKMVSCAATHDVSRALKGGSDAVAAGRGSLLGRLVHGTVFRLSHGVDNSPGNRPGSWKAEINQSFGMVLLSLSRLSACALAAESSNATIDPDGGGEGMRGHAGEEESVVSFEAASSASAAAAAALCSRSTVLRQLGPLGFPVRTGTMYLQGVKYTLHRSHGTPPEHRVLERWQESQAERSFLLAPGCSGNGDIVLYAHASSLHLQYYMGARALLREPQPLDLEWTM
ncbi:hypothetical protein BDV19DRAFT_166812 [Aspergillus venezuelensis]